MSTIYAAKPPILSARQIESISNDLLMRFIPSILSAPQSVPISLLIEKHLGMDLDYKCLSENKEVLGMVAFSDGFVEVYDDDRVNNHYIEVKSGTIIIENDLVSPRHYKRGRFTMAHEMGHWILHKDICKKMYRCTDKPRKLLTNNDWAEWQADSFAAAILMPKSTFSKEFYKFKKSINASRRDEFFKECAAEHLADLFKVSYQAAIVRIEKLCLY